MSERERERERERAKDINNLCICTKQFYALHYLRKYNFSSTRTVFYRSLYYTYDMPYVIRDVEQRTSNVMQIPRVTRTVILYVLVPKPGRFPFMIWSKMMWKMILVVCQGVRSRKNKFASNWFRANFSETFSSSKGLKPAISKLLLSAYTTRGLQQPRTSRNHHRNPLF